MTKPLQSRAGEMHRRNEILQRLLEISLSLNGSVSLKPLLNSIMEAACEIVDSEAASILLYVSNTDELRFAASNTPGENIETLMRVPVPLEGSVAGQIARENRPIIIQDATVDPRIYRPVDLSIGFVTRSLLGVPLHIKGNVIGVLEALNKRTGRWTEDDVYYVSILASHAAVAIQNARQAEAIRKAYTELDKLDKIKNDFIAIASHELRTPLGVILGYASFLKEEAQGEASGHADAVLNSALHLRTLIEDMTNLRYLHLGKVDLHQENVQISSLVRAVLLDVQSLAQANNQQIHFDPTFGETVVSIDKSKIAMALTNILNNAIKFTPVGGKITIQIEPRPREIWVRVTDTGVGIPEDQLEKIFDEFHQVADHMTRRQNGMGLGLAIARGMVTAHGGRVWAESRGANRGSTFTIALPI
jgi:signal transduction histidine kinase